MKANQRWLSLLLLAVIPLILFLALASLASGQGPVLITLPTPTPMLPPPDAGTSTDLSAQATLPDLVVEKIETSPITPTVSQSTLISVTIKNIGPGDVYTGTFLTGLYIDPPIIPVVGLPPTVSWWTDYWRVPAGAARVLTTTWVFTDVKIADTVDIWAMVDSNGEFVGDPDGNVTEANESNNTNKIGVSILTTERFTQTTHQDFLTNMASTLDNDDPSGVLRLGHFIEPPFIGWPLICEITTSTVISSDYNIQTPDIQLNDVITTGNQIKPHLIADGDGAVIAVWEDSSSGNFTRTIRMRYSTDSGVSWGSVTTVPDSISGDQSNPVAAINEDGILFVAWQDDRSGDYDIYAQKYELIGTTLTPSGGNMLVGGTSAYTTEDQINPDIVVDDEGGFHVVWQDNRNGNYDIFATSYISVTGSYTWTEVRRVHDDPNLSQQENPAIQVLDWLEPTSVDYTIAPDPPYTVTVNSVISETSRILVVAWEDDRYGNTDIAMVASGDNGETFNIDQFITQSTSDGDQQNLDVALSKSVAKLDFKIPLPDGSQTTVEVEVPVADIHTVWEGYSTPTSSDGDIYYNASELGVEQIGASNQFRLILTLGGNEKINQNDSRAWQSAPVDQRDPAVTTFPCGTDVDAGDHNVFISWADGRNYDGQNYDIYHTIRSDCEGMPEGLATNLMLNDGARLHNFNPNDPIYFEHDRGYPPPASQFKPTVAADIRTNWPSVLGGYVYLAWEDNRAADPQAGNDIYFARSNLTYFQQYIFPYGTGSQISNILGSESYTSTWYAVDWEAKTPDSAYITIQTRLGDTITDVLNSDWYPKRFPYQPQPWDCIPDNVANQSGAPLPGYDAPGQHIEGPPERAQHPNGKWWPKARFIQYRVNFFTRDSTQTPELSDLFVHFEPGIVNSNGGSNNGSNHVYLPLVLK